MINTILIWYLIWLLVCAIYFIVRFYIFNKKENEQNNILDDYDYLIFERDILGTNEVVLANKDRSLVVHYNKLRNSALCIPKTSEMCDTMTGREKQLEKEVLGLIKLGVVKELPVCEVPALRVFLLDIENPQEVIWLLTSNIPATISMLFGDFHQGRGASISRYAGKADDGEVKHYTKYLDVFVCAISKKPLQSEDKVFIKIKL